MVAAITAIIRLTERRFQSARRQRPKVGERAPHTPKALSRRASDVGYRSPACEKSMPSKTNTIDDLAARIPDAIARLRTLARHTLQTDLSEDYAAFLGRNDGLDFNGHVIYGATEHKEPVLSGFVEANDRLGWPQAGALDRPARDVIATFPSCGDAHECAAGCRRGMTGRSPNGSYSAPVAAYLAHCDTDFTSSAKSSTVYPCPFRSAGG